MGNAIYGRCRVISQIPSSRKVARAAPWEGCAYRITGSGPLFAVRCQYGLGLPSEVQTGARLRMRAHGDPQILVRSAVPQSPKIATLRATPFQYIFESILPQTSDPLPLDP